MGYVRFMYTGFFCVSTRLDMIEFTGVSNLQGTVVGHSLSERIRGYKHGLEVRI